MRVLTLTMEVAGLVASAVVAELVLRRHRVTPSAVTPEAQPGALLTAAEVHEWQRQEDARLARGQPAYVPPTGSAFDITAVLHSVAYGGGGDGGRAGDVSVTDLVAAAQPNPQFWMTTSGWGETIAPSHFPVDAHGPVTVLSLMEEFEVDETAALELYTAMKARVEAAKRTVEVEDGPTRGITIREPNASVEPLAEHKELL